MTNRDIAEKIFDYMKKNGFRPYDINYENQYGDDLDFITFRVKGINRHWKCCLEISADNIGVTTYSSSALQFFSQWDHHIDKFKASRSSVRAILPKDPYDENKFIEYMTGVDTERVPLIFKEIIWALEMVRRHPILCYCDVCGDYAGYHSYSFLWRFLTNEIRYYWCTFLTFFYNIWCHIIMRYKNWRVNRYDFVESCTFEEFFDTGNYDFECVFTADATDEQMYKVYKLFKKQFYDPPSMLWAYGAIKYRMMNFRQVGCDDRFWFD